MVFETLHALVKINNPVTQYSFSSHIGNALISIWFLYVLFVSLIYTSNLRAHLIRVDREKDIRTLEVQYISDINVCNNILWYCFKDVYNENIGVYQIAHM